MLVIDLDTDSEGWDAAASAPERAKDTATQSDLSRKVGVVCFVDEPEIFCALEGLHSSGGIDRWVQ